MKKFRKSAFAMVVLLVIVSVTIANKDRLIGLYRDLTFNHREHTQTELYVKAYADEHGLNYGDYPESLISLLARNPETEKFVLEYPTYEQTDWNLTSYASSGSFPLFLQWDQRWGYETYGSDCIGITGCGPTCLAMVGYYLTGEASFNPKDIAAFSEENGYYASGYGSSWTLISEGGEKLGLDVTEIPLVKKRITDNLEVGNPIILAVGAGHFTTSGHYIVISGMEDGLFRIQDPNSIANSSKLWSYEEIESEIRNLWVIRYLPN